MRMLSKTEITLILSTRYFMSITHQICESCRLLTRILLVNNLSEMIPKPIVCLVNIPAFSYCYVLLSNRQYSNTLVTTVIKCSAEQETPANWGSI